MYKLSHLPNTIIRLSDRANIPMVESNTDYREYLDWVANGGAVEQADEPFTAFIISRRQFYQQAAIAGFITQQEAIDAMSGTIPTTLETVVAQLPNANDQFNARMILSGASTFMREHPLVENVRLSLNLTPSDINNFFQEASLL